MLNVICITTWQHPSKKEEEYTPELVDKLPDGLSFINITGGQPFLRKDIEEIKQI
jgi:molybdenum cofactor biosynthesis enzyme MoaA